MARPPAPINWNEVDKLLKSGCDGVEIAAHIGIHPKTFYERCQDDNGVRFTEYASEKKSAGNALLRTAQFNKALKGDSGMLKWLGIFRLGQKDTNLNEVEEASRRGAIDGVREIIEENRTRITDASRSHVEDEQSLLDQRLSREESEIPDELGTKDTL